MNYPQQDKLLHYAVGTISFTLVNFLVTSWIALLFVVVLGAGKEVYDKFTPNHTADVKDFLYTVGGGVVGYLCTINF